MRAVLCCVLALFLSSCSGTRIVPVSQYDTVTEGLRICENKAVILVTPSSFQISFIPNRSRMYAVQFFAFLSKNDTTLQLDNGCVVKQADVKLDTTAIIGLLQDALKKLPDVAAATAPAASTKLSAMYEIDFDEEGHIHLRRVRFPV